VDISTIQDGRSSRQDLLMMFGEPDLWTADESRIFWIWDEAVLLFAMYGGVGGEATRHVALAVVLDERGIVTRHEVLVDHGTLLEERHWYLELRAWK
jgi:hypothetical protein